MKSVFFLDGVRSSLCSLLHSISEGIKHVHFALSRGHGERRQKVPVNSGIIVAFAARELTATGSPRQEITTGATLP
jgi:hypothetical protein